MEMEVGVDVDRAVLDMGAPAMSDVADASALKYSSAAALASFRRLKCSTQT